MTNIQQRREKLKQFLELIIKKEEEIINALQKDFKKPAFETYVTEIFVVQSDLRHLIKNMVNWSKPKKVAGSWLNFPSSNYIYREPYGKVLVISPWNYPFQLAICPALWAFAAGNSVVLKPSELAPNTASLLSEMIREIFEVKELVAVLGDVEIAKNLLQKKWDYIFFTGSPKVGIEIARAAAKNLTPVTLELGGKNPCIVHKSAKIELAAKKIAWGKFLNAGQTCIAPDYLLVDDAIKNKFIEAIKKEIISFFGSDIAKSDDYARIINRKHYNRLKKLLESQNVIFGGDTIEDDHFVAPTLVENPSLESDIMQDEIFGPILPILTFSSSEDIEKIISKYDKPLSLYVFAEDKNFSEKIIKKYPFGGGCVNDVIIHFSNKNLPFGGVGKSGIGAYHGKDNFLVFCHQKSIVKKATWADLTPRYAPYGNRLKFLKKIMRWL
ncbi:aldehyde dehydrogenase family protein [Flavobacterium sp. NST-5]|uniref:Aldehyde dehydrogenase n=1 Tax=Flavobacterium ichthyis TaxID=2698827 RepID=A0ABW9Z506_9FLAO|nr:aldehyde dehydrogenase [Flavobacterium ichthyis]NBL63923.1 aldehyde dehydrogenase family protein [Flavobacterium ichthyis]